MAVKYPWAGPLKKNNMDWHYEWPSDTTRVQYRGDIDKCMSHEGDARTLLYQLKAYMSIPDLDERLTVLSRTRNYLDGTTIYASSCWGIDTIIISATKDKKEGENPFCNLILIDVPEVVPPMKYYTGGETWTSVVGDDGYKIWTLKDPYGVAEVEGVDYIKTYYSYSMTDCPGCISPIFTLSNRVAGQNVLELSSPSIEPEAFRRSFRYKSERDDGSLIYTYDEKMVPHYMGDAEHSILPEPKTHTIYSFDGLNTTHKGSDAQAEIIKFSSDAGGAYIFWKAYTDYDYWFSRGGLGYMLMKAFGYDGGAVLCESKPNIIKVDCCEKVTDLRKVEIWWEGIAGSCTGVGEWFMNYGGTDICKTPIEMSSSNLFFYTSVFPYQPFYSIPEVKGSCLPIEWTLSGTIGFRGSEKNDSMIYTIWGSGSVGCYDEAIIKLTDRCGTIYQVRGVPCCENPAPIEIIYTSLAMTCGGKQTFSTQGGCGGFTWEVTSGGGTITQLGVYTAPATNPNCTSNPTITATDCCGNTGNITLSVNCYTTGTTIAYGYSNILECEGGWFSTLGCDQGMGTCFDWIIDRWNCAGVNIYHCETRPCGTCVIPPGSIMGYCYGNSWTPKDWDCFTGQCGGSCAGTAASPCLQTKDCRTAAMIEAGCCPINPITGLPL